LFAGGGRGEVEGGGVRGAGCFPTHRKSAKDGKAGSCDRRKER
jgi:hypothetical protein